MNTILSHRKRADFMGFDISPDNSKLVYSPGFTKVKIVELDFAK